MPDNPPNLTVRIDRTNQVAESIRKLAKLKVMVGIPSDGEQKQGTGSVGPEARQGTQSIGNAALGYIHEHGSPAQNIPPRPFLVPGVVNSKDKWSTYLEQAARAAFEGNQGVLEKALYAAGITAVSAVKARITAGIPPPLKPATVRRRQKRSKGSTYRRAASSASDTTPLVDTAQMLNSISFVVRKG